MKPPRIARLSQSVVCILALLSCFVLSACNGLFGGHGGKNLTSPVTGLTASAASGQVTLSWSAYPAASSYNVWRSTTSTTPPASGPISYLTGNVQSPFTDTTVINGTTYYYAVNANGSWGVSNFSNVAAATP